MFKTEGRIGKKKRRTKKIVKEESESIPMETQTGYYAKNSIDKLSPDRNSIESVKTNGFISILPDGFWAAQLTAQLIKATSDSVFNLQ